MTVDEQLAWEARQRPRGAIAALLGALGSVAAIAVSVSLGTPPRASLLTSLGRAAEDGRAGDLTSLRLPYYQWYEDHLLALLAASLLTAIGFFGLGYALGVLANATRARLESLPRWAVPLPLIGGVLTAVAVITFAVTRAVEVSAFLDSPHTVADAENVNDATGYIASNIIGIFGSMSVSLALVLVGLHAMRAGLLTRFMGVLAILIGALVLLQIGPAPVVQAFWLGALALLFTGRWPGGEPPAWRAVEAVPWPSARDLRAAPQPEPPSAPEPRVQHPSSRKRKRKRRA